MIKPHLMVLMPVANFRTKRNFREKVDDLDCSEEEDLCWWRTVCK